MTPRRAYESNCHAGAQPARYVQGSNPLETTFYKIIQDGQPDQIMNTFLDVRYEHLVASLPQTTFVEAFQLLSPAYFVVPYREIHRALHPTAVRLKKYKPLQLIFLEFSANITTIVQIRQSAGHALCLAEYKHLLDCARSMGDRPMADLVWGELMNDPAVTPDLQCYNYYMDAMIWDHAYIGLEKYRLRMTPFAYRKRSNKFTDSWGYQGYHTRSRSVNGEVLNLFNRLTESGIAADEETYVNVLLASARVGNIRGIKNVLQAVWNIDVDSLCAGNPKTPQARPLDRSSPLYPTERLLFAVAHGFGTNSDMVAAMRTMDFISRSYSIPAPEHVWLDLFERAFVLSRPRLKLPDPEVTSVDEIPPNILAHAYDGEAQSLGQISARFLFQLCDTMTSSPYNFKPTIDMYRMLAKTAWTNRSLVEFQQFMRSAYDLLRNTRCKRKEARLILEDYLTRLVSPGGNIDPLLLQSRGFADAVRTYDILRLRTAQHTIIMERLARLLLIAQQWVPELDTRWERWHLPLALEEWQDFLPEIFEFFTSNGSVKFAGKSGWTQQYVNVHKMTPRRRRTPDAAPDFEEETAEIDDDFFWGKYRESSPLGQHDHYLLKRVFWDIRPGHEYVESEGEILHRVHAPKEGETKKVANLRQLHAPVVPFRRLGKDHVTSLYSTHYL